MMSMMSVDEISELCSHLVIWETLIESFESK